ncbi:hypothetical protein EB796_011759 [Bugula neritina]|uniref:Uncharacterized protein n=1 Tax=Bugula neritina TaxID=10212 RepID=A0A7J7JU74_BUGNE|nr:hypothetical protein EB796_011759 [Bugula neritina]
MSEKKQYNSDLPPSYEVSSEFLQNTFSTPGTVQAGYATSGTVQAGYATPGPVQAGYATPGPVQAGCATPGPVQAGHASVGYSPGHVTTLPTSFPACSPGVGMTHQPGGPLSEVS